MDDPGISSETMELVKEIGEAAGRASNLTKQLLAFSRQQVMQIRRINLNEVLVNVTRMLGRLLGEDISLQCNFSSTPPTVEADSGMLEQVIINLAVNARDAMPHGGTLFLVTKIETIDGAKVNMNSEAKAGRYALLIVRDTGCGIPSEKINRIFDPFYTTKEKGKGTGLGLATVYGIVKQHHGWIEVESKVGIGTSFEVYLPLSDTLSTSIKPTANNKSSLHKGTETILVVEDEQAVRKLITSVLNRCGYRIYEASNGIEAKLVWQKNASEIDLMITDMVMPGGISGADLATYFLTERPHLKLVFCSGYSYDVINNNSAILNKGRFISKPFEPGTLSRVVRECLDGKQNESNNHNLLDEAFKNNLSCEFGLGS